MKMGCTEFLAWPPYKHEPGDKSHHPGMTEKEMETQILHGVVRHSS